jgi:cytochrome c oxidase subunit 1
VAAIELDQNESAREGDVADAPDMEGREEQVKGRTTNPEENA